MSLRLNKSIFYHIPKTGGTWVNYAIRKAMIDNKDLIYRRPKLKRADDDYSNWREVVSHSLGMRRAHETQWGIANEEKDDIFSFTFVRKPLDWYKSYWADRKFSRETKNKKYWGAFPLDFAWDESFDQFVLNATKMFSQGALTLIYQSFLGLDGDDLDFVGRQENLVEDLVKALTLAGEDFNEEKLRNVGKKNVSAPFDFGLSNSARSKLLRRERWVTKTFYD